MDVIHTRRGHTKALHAAIKHHADYHARLLAQVRAAIPSLLDTASVNSGQSRG